MITTPVVKPGYELISQHAVVSVWRQPSSGQHSLHADKFFNAGDLIVDFSAENILDHATYLTVQIGLHNHITLSPSFLQYVNHSCEPTVIFDTTAMQLICIKALSPGDECCFFYPSTEWIMAQPFVCNCGADNCLTLIKGAAFLDKQTLQRYQLTDFIKEQFQLQQ